MVLQRTFVTPEAFDRFVDLPENTDKLFEYIGHEAIEVCSAPYSSAVASQISFHVGTIVHLQHLGHVTGEGAGYVVNGERYVPSLAYTSRLRLEAIPRTMGYVSLAPDFAVEVLSPLDNQRYLNIKIANYLAAGTLLWIVYPETKTVEIYAPGQPMRWVGIDDTLDGGDVLPGFTLSVREIFPD